MPAPLAVARLLRSLDVPERRLPADVNELVTLRRSVTATRRLLVLLDNAGSAHQVEPLLPATPCCLVYVTARTVLPDLVAGGAVESHVADLLRKFGFRAPRQRNPSPSGQMKMPVNRRVNGRG